MINVRSLCLVLGMMCLLGCKSEVGDISGNYESLPNSFPKFEAKIDPSRGLPKIGQIFIFEGKKTQEVGDILEGENFLGQKSYSVTIWRGVCAGAFEVAFTYQVEKPMPLHMRIFGNSRCPAHVYELSRLVKGSL